MRTLIMEGNSVQRRTGQASRRAVTAGVVCVVGMAMIGAPGTASGQDKKKEPFRAKVVDSSGQMQQITIPLHRSVTVETNVEATRADVVARQVSDVQIVSGTRIIVTGEDLGTTTVVLQGADGNQYVFDVIVEPDLAALNESIKKIDPLSDASASAVQGSIILTGRVSNLDRARRMAELAELFLPMPDPERTHRPVVQNHLEVAGEQQVLLRVTVAEVSRAAARELGINGFLAGENFRDGFLVNQLGGINPLNIGAAGGVPVTQNMPFVTDENGLVLSPNSTLSLGFPRAQTQLFIRAMSDNRLLSILAEPNLVAISGETASFLAGGEFPIPVPQGNQQVTIDFREFGVRLNFTPIVRGQQLIRLRVAPEVSELDFSTAVQIEGFVVPGLTTRSTETTVELTSGQTIAIAGLLNEQVRGLASRVPGVGDVPVLGALFRSVNFQRSLTELVVLVTPEIVAPLEANQTVSLPTDDRQDPTDVELFALGLIDGKDEGRHGGHGRRCGNRPCHGVESEPDELSLHGPWGPTESQEVR
ncbi:MAG: type II and III secretion system protein family protein [Planctomycetota bacterium]